MKPPWDHSASGAGDLEALQTDVMRFIAIIGLCLAAIFSLVNGAREEAGAEVGTRPSTAGSEAVESPGPRPLEHRPKETVPTAPSAGATLAAPGVTADTLPVQDEQKGFTLEFRSGGALRQLVESGVVELFAGVDGRFRVYRPGSGFQPADAPASFYRMQPETVPEGLRSLMPAAQAGQHLEWGVTLPDSTRRELQQLIKGRAGGSLLIDADAGVTLEGAPPVGAREKPTGGTTL